MARLGEVVVPVTAELEGIAMTSMLGELAEASRKWGVMISLTFTPYEEPDLSIEDAGRS